MELKSYFVIGDLPDGTWSVSWPGYEYYVVNTVNKAHKLLKILFEDIKVDRAQMAILWHQETDLNRARTLEIDVAAWWGDDSAAADYLAGNVVLAVKFDQLEQAEAFKKNLEQRLSWRRLGGEWK